MPQTVYVLGTDDSGQSVTLGTLTLTDRGVEPNPPGEAVLESVMNTRMLDPRTGTPMMIQSDPAGWLANVHRAVSGSYLRATKPVEV